MRLYTIETGESIISESTDTSIWFDYNKDGLLHKITHIGEYPSNPIFISYNSKGSIDAIIRSSSKSISMAKMSYFSKRKYFYNNNLIQRIIKKTSYYIGSKPFIEYSNYYIYDDFNKLVSLKEFRGDKETLKSDTTYYYNDLGKIKKEIYNSSSDKLFIRDTKLKYDSEGTLVEKTHTYQEDKKTSVSKHLYQYDNNGNLSEEKIYDIDGKLLNNYKYKYNSANLIEYKNFIEMGFGRSIIRIPGFSKYEYQDGNYVDIYSLMKDFI